MTTTADMATEARQQVSRWWNETEPDSLNDRVVGARGALAHARACGDPHLVAAAWRLHLMTLLEAEHVPEIDTTLGELNAWCASRRGNPAQRVLDWFRALRAILDGDPEQAESLLATAVSPREALGPITTIRCFQGRFDELEDAYRTVRRDEPAHATHVVMLAWLWAQQGRLTAARGTIESLGPLDALPRDRDYLVRITLLAELAIAFNDQPLAQRLYGMLLPYAKRIVLIGNGSGCWGSTDRALGLLSRFLGRFEDAVEHFEAKIALAAAAGAHPWLARGQLDLAELLLERAESPAPGAVTESTTRMAGAIRCAREGIAAARRLDYQALRDRADRLHASLRCRQESAVAAPVPVAGITAPDAAAAADRTVRICVLGEFAAITTGGEEARWTSHKAMVLLCVITAARGRSISRESLMEHLWPGHHPRLLRNRLSVAISTARRTLDPTMLAARDWFISTTPDTVRLRHENVIVDAEVFLRAGAAALAAARASTAHGGEGMLTASGLAEALGGYGGEAFAHYPYAEWATPLRDECLAMYVALQHAAIDGSSSDLERSDAARQILAVDPYNEQATTILAEALQGLGARGLAEAARQRLRSSLE